MAPQKIHVFSLRYDIPWTLTSMQHLVTGLHKQSLYGRIGHDHARAIPKMRRHAQELYAPAQGPFPHFPRLMSNDNPSKSP
jgi:hypothetical protein